METPPIPSNEAARLRNLLALKVLDSAPEAEFDALVRAAALVCGVPISLLSLVDADRQWFKANVGLEGVHETDRESAFCAHAIGGTVLFEVPDATRDDRFKANRLVTGAPDIRFYAGAPLVLADGTSLGTLCVIDREPRTLTDTQREILVNLAQAAVRALEGRRAAIELHQSEAQQRALVAELALAHRNRGDFLATLAHELRNPLSALKTASFLLTRAPDHRPTVERVTGVFERQLAHMSRLVTELTDASKIAAGKIDLQVEDADLAAVIASALEASAAEVERGRHTLAIDVPDFPVVVRLDAVRVAQIVSNLVVNAAKYTPNNGNIELQVTIERNDLTIAVKDDGCGLAPGDLEHIFEMFVQVRGQDSGDQGGLGVGLALVARIAELHGGRVQAVSEGLGRGSTFTVALPGVVRR